MDTEDLKRQAASAEAANIEKKLMEFTQNSLKSDDILKKLSNQSPTNETEYRLKLVLAKIKNS